VIYLSDNDVVEKLAVCDLLDDAISAFDATRADVRVIPTLKFRIWTQTGVLRPKLVRRLGDSVVNRLAEFVGSVGVIDDFSRDDHQLLEDLDESVEIDPGEIVLLAATAVVSDFRLLTGDKRCLRAVATHPACESIANRIRGKVVCFEQIICQIIDRSGFEHVRSKVVPVLHNCDTALRAAFGSGDLATKDNAVACLHA
jgi:hypothetical protein